MHSNHWAVFHLLCKPLKYMKHAYYFTVFLTLEFQERPFFPALVQRFLFFNFLISIPSGNLPKNILATWRQAGCDIWEQIQLQRPVTSCLFAYELGGKWGDRMRGNDLKGRTLNCISLEAESNVWINRFFLEFLYNSW